MFASSVRTSSNSQVKGMLAGFVAMCEGYGEVCLFRPLMLFISLRDFYMYFKPLFN